MVMLDLLVLGRRVLIGVEASRGPTPEDGNFVYFLKWRNPQNSQKCC